MEYNRLALENHIKYCYNKVMLFEWSFVGTLQSLRTMQNYPNPVRRGCEGYIYKSNELVLKRQQKRKQKLVESKNIPRVNWLAHFLCVGRRTSKKR